jgi:AhpD family alkylhydroperoxidase
MFFCTGVKNLRNDLTEDRQAWGTPNGGSAPGRTRKEHDMQLKMWTVLIVAGALLAIPGIAAETGSDQAVEDQKIISRYEAENGFVPNPLYLMAERPGVLKGFMAHGLSFFEGGPLTERERLLVSLAAAVALKSPQCINAHERKFLNAGGTRDEIVQVILIAGFIGNTSALQVAWDAADIFKPPEGVKD